MRNQISKDCLIIDPGFDTDLIDAEIKKSGLNPIAILSTHGHFDHVAGVDYFKTKYNIPFYLHEKDKKICLSINFYLKIARIDMTIRTPIPDILIKEKTQSISIKSFNLIIQNFPGHSDGSCIIQSENFLFTGDILYRNGLGAGSIPRENPSLLRRSILSIFKSYSDNAIILPGHGAPDYLGNIKNNNIELKNYLTQIV
ncbi:MAG: MBL fold metallo-hydrolase [Bacteroidia bacterium]|nr:MBL fold metallo-hydrolase [Bacteroidia bacterium]